MRIYFGDQIFNHFWSENEVLVLESRVCWQKSLEFPCVIAVWLGWQRSL